MPRFLFACIALSTTSLLSAQDRWFTTYTDSAALVNDAQRITDRFIADVQAIAPDLVFRPKPVAHTTPYMVFYSAPDNTVNLPLWAELPPELKGFLGRIGGDEATGRALFGHFFNGFYLPHELGHALVAASSHGSASGSYAEERLANALAMQWWREHARGTDIDSCYALARTALSHTPVPDTGGQDIAEFLTANYERATQDPFLYGYIQFGQFIALHDDPAPASFADQVRRILGR